MHGLVNRFHLLLFGVTLAVTGVAWCRIPEDYAFPAHWQGSGADWLWPRDEALIAGPMLQLLVLGAFLMLGRVLTANHLGKVRHILDPALSVLLAVIGGVQFGLLLNGIGSDIDFVRFVAVALGLLLLPLGVVLFEAERHTYAGMRMPWPIGSDRAWRIVHRGAGAAFCLAGLTLLALAWFDVGMGWLAVALASTFSAPLLLAGLLTVLTRGR